MTETVARHGVASFLVLTFLISLVSGSAAFLLGGRDTFASTRAMPLLLVTIWSPNIAALLVANAQGRVTEILSSLSFGAEPLVWLLALFPLAVALALGMRAGLPETLGASSWLLLIVLNLVMGPLGEELGWRGFLLPELLPRLGTVGAALTVGAIWALWHLPLWWLPSPHQAISFPIFFVTVLCFSLIMAALWLGGSGTLWPIVLFHLCANVGVGWLEATGTMSAANAYRSALPLYLIAALLSAGWLGYQSRHGCSLEQAHSGFRASGTRTHTQTRPPLDKFNAVEFSERG